MRQILSERDIKVIDFPEVEFFMQAGNVPEYVYQKSFAETRLKPLALGLGIYCELTCVLPPPNVPLTARLVDRIHSSVSANL